jgi:hypothetical protein
MQLTTYDRCGEIIYRLDWEGGYLECKNIQVAARVIVRYFSDSWERAGTA